MHIDKKTLRNIFIGVIACIVLYWLLHDMERVKSIFSVVGNVLSPFAVGAGIAFVLNVPMRAFERLLQRIKNQAFRRILSLALTFIAVAIILAGVLLLLIPQLVDTIESLIPKMRDFFVETGAYITDFVGKNQGLFVDMGLDQLDWAGIAEKFLSMVGDGASSFLSNALSTITSAPGFLMDAFISVVFAVYCLFQKENLARQGRKLLYAFVPEKISDRVIKTLRLTNVTFSNFLSGQCIEVCILGALFAIAMAIFGMPYIPLVSVLVAVTAFIPVVGAWVGCIVGAFVIFVSNPMQALWFVIMFIVLQQIENNLIYPRVVGASIGLSGMWVLVAVGVGGELMGVAGMFIMIPIASVLYTLLRQVTNERLKRITVDPEKLKEQPPELSRIRKKIREHKKKKNSD